MDFALWLFYSLVKETVPVRVDVGGCVVLRPGVPFFVDGVVFVGGTGLCMGFGLGRAVIYGGAGVVGGAYYFY